MLSHQQCLSICAATLVALALAIPPDIPSDEFVDLSAGRALLGMAPPHPLHPTGRLDKPVDPLYPTGDLDNTVDVLKHSTQEMGVDPLYPTGGLDKPVDVLKYSTQEMGVDPLYPTGGL